jgi:hypothetical protein
MDVRRNAHAKEMPRETKTPFNSMPRARPRNLANQALAPVQALRHGTISVE